MKIWRDLLKIDIYEFEERRAFKKRYSQSYDEAKSVYRLYKDMASKSDCLAFRQIDEDAEAFEFPPLFCKDLPTIERELKLMEAKR